MIFKRKSTATFRPKPGEDPGKVLAPSLIRRQVQGWPLRIGFLVACTILLVVAAVGQRPDIPTGGHIPDRRGFQGVNDPRYQDMLKNGVVTRHVGQSLCDRWSWRKCRGNGWR